MYPGLRRADKATNGCDGLDKWKSCGKGWHLQLLMHLGGQGKQTDQFRCIGQPQPRQKRPTGDPRPMHTTHAPRAHYPTCFDPKDTQREGSRPGSRKWWRAVEVVMDGAWRVVDGGLDAAMSVRAGLVSLQ